MSDYVANRLSFYVGHYDLWKANEMGHAAANINCVLSHQLFSPLALEEVENKTLFGQYHSVHYSLCSLVFRSLLTGIVGSLILEYFGWRIVFLTFGSVSLFWALVMRLLISMEKIKTDHMLPKSTNPSFVGDDEPLIVKEGGGDNIQWRKVLTYNSFW